MVIKDSLVSRSHLTTKVLSRADHICYHTRIARVFKCVDKLQPSGFRHCDSVEWCHGAKQNRQIVAESLRILKRLTRGTSEEAKVSRRRSYWGRLGVQQQYDEITTREKLDLSVDWMFVFYRSVANGVFSSRKFPSCFRWHVV